MKKFVKYFMYKVLPDKLIHYLKSVRFFLTLDHHKKDTIKNIDFDEFMSYILLDKNSKKILKAMPLGHYYSPVPNLSEIRQNENRIFETNLDGITGVDLRIEEQTSLAKSLSSYMINAPFTEEQMCERRFFHQNPSLNELDSLVLHAMLMHVRPKKLIEVGSGYSSAMTLDTNEMYLDKKIDCTFIEPYPETLYSILKENDKAEIKIIQQKLQDVDLEVFDSLEHGDILFVDSTHVSKIGSDVNQMFFKILPRLKNGVIIHFHDILYPFMYPKIWTYETCFHWNEAFLLRAFLQYNDSFKIKFWAPALYAKNVEVAKRLIPIKRKNENPLDAGSIWLEKIK